MSGIRGAQKEFLKDNSAYAPLISPENSNKIHDLEFDLAVTIDDSSSKLKN